MISFIPFRKLEPLPNSDHIDELEAHLDKAAERRRRLVREILELCRPQHGADD